MILTTDFHTHILPGIDDGSQTVDDSVEMLLKEQSDGVRTIVLTPHFYPQQMYPVTFVEKRQQAMELLFNALSSQLSTLRFISGAEVLFCPGMSQWDQLDMLTLGDSKYILIEIPLDNWSDSVYLELKRIQSERGLTPILAHIERYLPTFGIHKFVNRLNALPVLLQSNCEFLTDKRTQRIALKLICDKKIHFFGSDCHGPSWRSPVMAQAREILLNNADEQTLFFLEKMESSIIQN